MGRRDKLAEYVAWYESVPTVVRFRSLIRRLWGLELGFADPDGWVIPPASAGLSQLNQPFLYGCFLDDAATLNCANRIVEAQRANGSEFSKPFTIRCGAGLNYLVLPLFAKNIHLGSVIAGSFLKHFPSETEKVDLRQWAKMFHGGAASSVEEEINRIPVLSEHDIRLLEKVISFGVQEIERMHAYLAKKGPAEGKGIWNWRGDMQPTRS